MAPPANKNPEYCNIHNCLIINELDIRKYMLNKSINRRLYKDFFRFLKEQNKFLEWADCRVEFVHRNPDKLIQNSLTRHLSGMLHDVSSSFDWSRSKLGWDYWYDVNKQLYKFVKQNHK